MRTAEQPGGFGTRARVLVVGADRRLVSQVRAALPVHRYALTAVTDVPHALDSQLSSRPDVVLVTSRPDGEDGVVCCRELQTAETVPVILLTAHSDTLGAVRALTRADDYISLPVALEEMDARVRVALRHAAGGGQARHAIFDDGHLRVHLRHRTVTFGGRAPASHTH